MLLNKRGQLGPQGLEDLPMAVMAFIVGIAAVIMLLDISSAHLTESKLNDMHNTGKRLVENLVEVFKSDESGRYGDQVLDEARVNALHQADPSLRNVVGPVEYGFSAKVSYGSSELDFGGEPPAQALAYGGAVTVLSGGALKDGELTVKIWR